MICCILEVDVSKRVVRDQKQTTTLLLLHLKMDLLFETMIPGPNLARDRKHELLISPKCFFFREIQVGEIL